MGGSDWVILRRREADLLVDDVGREEQEIMAAWIGGWMGCLELTMKDFMVRDGENAIGRR